MKYRYSYVLMTKDEAQAILARHAAGKPVFAIELQEATRVMSKKRDSRMHLPELSPSERQRVNGVLLWHLGLALGRIEERKAA